MFAALIVACVFLGGANGPTGLDLDGALRRMEKTISEPERRQGIEPALRSLVQESRRYALLRARALQDFEQLEAQPGAQPEAAGAVLQRMEREEAAARARVLDARERLRASLTAEEWQSLFAPATTPGVVEYPSTSGS